ncbi:sister chromatid cohesion 1 protein 3 [Daucus carota subsp. sativus]
MEIDHEISTENNSPNRVLYSPIEFTPSPTGGHALGGDTSSLIDQVEPTNWDSTRVLEKYAATPGSNEITASLKGTPGEGPYNPEIRTSCDGELSFLAEDDNNSQGPQQTTPGYSSWKSEGGQLSARTRSVARFLKDRSSVTPVIERDHQSINVSLDTILEGKRRKVCARIVFETLVLKTCSLVDVKQENPYGDVVLTVTPKLSNELFSI